MSTRPTAVRRTSRVHFDDEILPALPPPVASPRFSTPALYSPQPQRWSVPAIQVDPGYGSQARQRVRYSEPAAHNNINMQPHRGMFRDPWTTTTSPPRRYRPDSPEEFPLRGRTSRVPVHTEVPQQPYPDSRDRRGSDDTLTGDDDLYDKFSPLPLKSSIRPRRESEYQPSTYNFSEGVSRAPGQPLRSALRRSVSEISSPMDVQDHYPRGRGVLSNLMALNGLNTRPRSSSVSSIVDNDRDLESGRPRLGLRHRGDSVISTGSAILDEDDPRVTGYEDTLKRQRALKHTTDAFEAAKKIKKTKKQLRGEIIHSMTDLVQRQTFILRLARALMYFGAPSHRIESQLVSVSRTLDIDAQFVHMPSIVICSFGDEDTKTSETHFVKANGRLMLGKLHNVHTIYRSVVHGHMDAGEGGAQLSQLLRSPPLYSIPFRCLLAFMCCFLICPMAFGGSLADAFISGLGGAVLSFLQLVVAQKNAMYADVFEISIAIIMSFTARALTAIPDNIFCYQAISSSAVVLILPGYLILCSSLELASKNMLAGSVRMVYAIIYSLFLGFGLTIGSDLAYLVFPNLRLAQVAAHKLDFVSYHGNFTSDNSTAALSSFVGSFTFSNTSHIIGEVNPETLLESCHRNPNSLFLLKSFPFWTLFLLVPAYSFISSLWNLQPVRSRQLPVMVFISCASFAANKAANHFIFDRSDVVSAIGAFVVGLLGNIYSRMFGGTAFQVMSVAVCFLIPSGIAATGGLSQNYHGQEGDSYSAGLSIGLRMVQVGIGITVGLFASGLVVYSFGSRKKNALFAF